ncbi:MAG: hypothetical protein L6264_13265, partial [Weeksellaceae bacterium]|nr:hypothetical protein [Weeksellaceae bacterium]
MLSINTKGDIKEYLNYILGNKKVRYENFASIINYHSNSTVIDLYRFLLTILNALSENTEQIKLVSKVLNILNREITDPRIRRMLEINSFSNEKIEIKSDLCLSILDKYSLGHYADVQILCIKQFKKNPNILYIYEIYIKSLLLSNSPFAATEVSKTID